jgi:hypothetical protein
MLEQAFAKDRSSANHYSRVAEALVKCFHAQGARRRFVREDYVQFVSS